MDKWKAYYAGWRSSTNNAGSSAFIISPDGEVLHRVNEGERRANASVIEQAVRGEVLFSNSGPLYATDGERSFLGREFYSLAEADDWIAENRRQDGRAWSGYMRNVAPYPA